MTSVKQKQYDWKITWDAASENSPFIFNYEFKIWDPSSKAYEPRSHFLSMTFAGGLRRAKRQAGKLSRAKLSAVKKEEAAKRQKEAYNKRAETRKGEEVFQVMLRDDK